MIKINLERVKGQTFYGYVNIEDFTADQLKTLGIVLTGEGSDPLTVEVSGDYDFEVYRGELCITGVSAFAYEGIHELELTADIADLDGLMDDIQDSDVPYELALCSGFDFNGYDE